MRKPSRFLRNFEIRDASGDLCCFISMLYDPESFCAPVLAVSSNPNEPVTIVPALPRAALSLAVSSALAFFTAGSIGVGGSGGGGGGGGGAGVLGLPPHISSQVKLLKLSESALQKTNMKTKCKTDSLVKK